MKKILIAVVAAIAIVTIIGYIKLKSNEPRKDTSHAVSALPSDVALFVETQNFGEFFTTADKQNIITKKILNAKQKHLLQKQHSVIKYLLTKYPKIKDLLKDHTVLVAFRRQGKTDINTLFVIETRSNSDQKKLRREIAYIIKNENLKIEYTQYNQAKVYIIPVGKEKIYLSNVKGLILISPSELLLQNSIRQLINKTSLLTDREFVQISTTSDRHDLATLYINHGTLWTILYPHLSLTGIRKVEDFQYFADWSALDVSMEKNIIRLYGYTSVEASPKKYLHIFQNTEGAKFSVDKILPAQTVEYIIFGYKSFKPFILQYKQYLIGKNLKLLYSQRNKTFYKKYKINPELDLLDKIGNTITIAKVRYDITSTTDTRYLIIKLDDKNGIEKLFQKYITAYAKQHNVNPKSFIQKYTAPGGVIVEISHLPSADFFNYLFGELYNLPPHQFYMFVDDYLIMSKDEEAIKHFADAYFSDQNLGHDKNYMNFRKNLTPKSSITYYRKKPFALGATNPFLNVKTKDQLLNTIPSFYGINNFALQFYPDKDNVFLTYAYLDYKPNKTPISYSIWQKKLAASINTKPFIFINHYTREKEIFVGDIKGNIYLINRNGDILWSRKVDGPIKGNIYMIDYYHNGKNQVLFNTANKIYIIDRRGKDVENFPITLPAEATASISVFDYDHDSNYRIFVPCSNNRVYLYTKEGKLNPGWLITQTSAPVKRPVQHFVYKGKDYIVFADDIHTYILNRRGETRIPVKSTFPKSTHADFHFIVPDNLHKKPLFLTTTKTGKLSFIDLQGNVNIVAPPHQFSDSHYFLLSDWNGDHRYEYIYLEGNKLYVYNEKLQLLVQPAVEFQGNILEQPHIYEFSASDKRVGFLTSANLIYLINNKGKVSKNFPKKSTTRFTITSLIPGHGFNLLVGNGQFLVNYKL